MPSLSSTKTSEAVPSEASLSSLSEAPSSTARDSLPMPADRTPHRAPEERRVDYRSRDAHSLQPVQEDQQQRGSLQNRPEIIAQTETSRLAESTRDQGRELSGQQQESRAVDAKESTTPSQPPEAARSAQTEGGQPTATADARPQQQAGETPKGMICWSQVRGESRHCMPRI